MKLLVSDYDLTFNSIDYDVWINKHFVKQFRDNGNLFFLNTGRSYESIKKEIDKFRINFDYLGCCDGNLILNKNLEIVYCTSLPSTILENLQSLKKDDTKFSCDAVTYQGKILEYVVMMYENDDGFSDRLNEFGNNNGLTVKNFKKLIFHKFKLKRGNYFYLGKDDISKSSAISIVSELENISRCDIFTIGDHLNDLEMIKDFNGYTLPWGKKEVKDVSQGKVLSVSSLVKKIMR